ncbi:MAG: EF-P lysine aminoacylase EpmA [Desulfobacterales bacterium]
MAPDAGPPGFRQTRLAATLVFRSRVIQAIRRFFEAHAYLEIETPQRIPAQAPEAHIDPQPSGGWFLQTSPELLMKRLLAAGYPRLFQICHCHRRGERGRRHLPEFTLLEWYRAGADYEDLMGETEGLIRFVAGEVGLGHDLVYQGLALDLRPPWPRLAVAAAFERHGSLSMAEALAASRFDEVMGLEIEPRLGQPRPQFLYDYPAAQGALARLRPGQPSVAERFELYIAGLELCNAFSELNDPVQQRARFETELAVRREGGKALGPMPEKFLAALGMMPAAAGNALGVDRLVMLLTDRARIDDVVAFTPEEL